MGPLPNYLGRQMFISDLQIPFEHEKALEFCKYVKRHFHIPDEGVYNVGDEVDEYWGSGWKKDPNAAHTATQEITETIERMRPWYDAFPQMRLAESNHGRRWMRKALEAEIPELMMRRYQSVIGCPRGWMWQSRWLIRQKKPVLVEHGDRFGGATPHLKAAEANACNTAIGHHHSKFGIEHSQTNGAMDGCPDEAGFKVWGMVTSCLIAFEKYAFHYARAAKNKPQIGLGICLDEGSLPILVPMGD